MKILIPVDVCNRLKIALEKARDREIGGILMGEHVASRCFRVVDLTVQYEGGAFAFFVRAVAGVRAALKQFFQCTSRNYRRYNYLGEWHSHPAFDLKPSGTDIQSMLEIVSDPQVGANFAILLITRLEKENELSATATAFFSDLTILGCGLVYESEESSFHTQIQEILHGGN